MLLRVFGTCGLGITFLLVSPPLRETVRDVIAGFAAYVQDNGPWSYCALVLAGLVVMMAWIHHSAQAR